MVSTSNKLTKIQLFDWVMGKLSKAGEIIMLDEAHNIEDVCRDSASIQSQEEGLKYDFILIYLLQKLIIQSESFEF